VKHEWACKVPGRSWGCERCKLEARFHFTPEGGLMVYKDAEGREVTTTRPKDRRTPKCR
jgi:hypothetical protein